jgi:hypothetical protein
MLSYEASNTLNEQKEDHSLFVKNIQKKMTRFQVHVIAHKQGEELGKTIQQIRECIDKNEIEHYPEYKENLKAISVYYAFYKRDKDLALTYLNKYQLVCETAQEKMEALSLIAYVHTIDPNFVDEDNLFAQVLHELDELPGKDKNTENEITRAFAKQYQAMIIHRRACFKKATNNNTDQALIIIDEAIATQRNLLSTVPLLKIGLAESMHLKAITLYRLANLEQDEKEKQNKFAETEALLTQAAKLEEEFCQETQAPHFLVATTLQSLARVLKNVGRSNETHAHYRRALEIQTSIFGDKPHEDIAKTWHFWAETSVQENNYPEAIDAFLNALLIKYKINYSNSNITKETENALMAALDNLQKQNNQLALVKCKQIYTALQDEENVKEFKNKDTVFIKLISAKLIQLTEIQSNEQKPVSTLRSYSLYSVEPRFDADNNTRSKMVESSQASADTPALQRSSCQNLRR